MPKSLSGPSERASLCQYFSAQCDVSLWVAGCILTTGVVASSQEDAAGRLALPDNMAGSGG